MLDIMTNAPRPITAGGKRYLVGSLKLSELGYLQRWIRDNGSCPVKALREVIDLVPEPDRAKAIADAKEERRRYWPPAPGTVEGNTILLGSPEGQAEFLRVVLGKFQPITEDELATVSAGLSAEDFGVLVAIAFGEDDLDPESARATARERLKALTELQEAVAHAVLDGGNSSPTTGENTKSSPTSSES